MLYVVPPNKRLGSYFFAGNKRTDSYFFAGNKHAGAHLFAPDEGLPERDGGRVPRVFGVVLQLILQPFN